MTETEPTAVAKQSDPYLKAFERFEQAAATTQPSWLFPLRKAGIARFAELGFPTANLRPQTPALPPHGVYAVEVIVDGGVLPGIANLGVRPTFGDEAKAAMLEVHLLDFAGDLYGRELEVAFVALIRAERKFANAAELSAQIARDIAAARTRLRA